MELEKIRNLTDEELTSQQSKAAEQLFQEAAGAEARYCPR
jgi:hypothetical protein